MRNEVTMETIMAVAAEYRQLWQEGKAAEALETLNRCTALQVDYYAARGNYRKCLFLLERPQRIPKMLEWWERIADDAKHELFEWVFCDSEGAFEEIPDEVLADVARLRPTLPKKITRVLEGKRIYRGSVLELGTPEQALSWTIDKKVAAYFANRWSKIKDGTPVIWSARITPEDVVAHISMRNEAEIVAKRGSVTDIRQES